MLRQSHDLRMPDRAGTEQRDRQQPITAFSRGAAYVAVIGWYHVIPATHSRLFREGTKQRAPTAPSPTFLPVLLLPSQQLQNFNFIKQQPPRRPPLYSRVITYFHHLIVSTRYNYGRYTECCAHFPPPRGGLRGLSRSLRRRCFDTRVIRSPTHSELRWYLGQRNKQTVFVLKTKLVLFF